MKHYMVALNEEGKTLGNVDIDGCEYVSSWTHATLMCGLRNAELHAGIQHVIGDPPKKIVAYEVVSEEEGK